MWVEDWVSAAACRDAADPDDLFASDSRQHRAKQVCARCPVRAECLAEAIDNQIEWGVWGGTTERERRVLLGRTGHTSNVSWRSVLESARHGFEKAPAALDAPSGAESVIAAGGG